MIIEILTMFGALILFYNNNNNNIDKISVDKKRCPLPQLGERVVLKTLNTARSARPNGVSPVPVSRRRPTNKPVRKLNFTLRPTRQVPYYNIIMLYNNNYYYTIYRIMYNSITGNSSNTILYNIII